MAIIQGGEVIESLRSQAIITNPDAHVFIVDPDTVSTYGLNEALAECVADRGDAILCLPGTQEYDEVVDIDVRGVTIMAANWGGNPTSAGERFVIAASSSYTDGPAVKITDPCRIIGMGISGRQTAGESLLIDSEALGGFSGGFLELLNCRFPTHYGAMDALIRVKGGQYIRIKECTFDGLFTGVGDSAISLEISTAIDVGYIEIVNNYFQSLGASKHAIQIDSDVTVSGMIKGNHLMAGFTAQGVFFDNGTSDSTLLIAENYVAPLANQAAAMENLTNFAGGFANNHYEEA